MFPINTGKNIVKGASLYAIGSNIFSLGTPLRLFHLMAFHPKELLPPLADMQTAAYEQATKTAEFLKTSGFHILITFDPEKILTASCLKEESLRQMSPIVGMPADPMFVKIMDMANACSGAPIREELYYRGLIQDLVLNRGVKKVIQKIKPEYAEKLDSKIYTAVRILLTSAYFAYDHSGNNAIRGQSYVDAQVITAFFAGIRYGILKENVGLAGAIGGDIMQNIPEALIRNFYQGC